MRLFRSNLYIRSALEVARSTEVLRHAMCKYDAEIVETQAALVAQGGTHIGNLKDKLFGKGRFLKNEDVSVRQIIRFRFLLQAIESS